MTDDWLTHAMKMAYFMFLALVGILMRHAHAAATTGKMEWRMFFLACLTAPGLGIIAGGLVDWAGAPPLIQYAIVATIGFLGPAFVHAFVLTVMNKWLANRDRT